MAQTLKAHLGRLRTYIDDSNKTNSNNDKIAVLKRYADDVFVKTALYYTYNNQLQFNVSIENLKKNAGICAPENVYNAEGQDGESLFAMLDDLHERNITGHAAISAVNAFLKEYAEFEREISYILDRNLQTRVTATIINKEFKGLIPEFEVALGVDYDKLEKKPTLLPGEWIMSRKMDGLRAVIHVDDDGNAIPRSREGNVFTTFSPICQKIKEMGYRNTVLDGEMCLLTSDGSDDFNGMQQVFRKKNHTIDNACYRLFDQLTHEEFTSRKSTRKLQERLDEMNEFLVDKASEQVRAIEQIPVKDQEHLDAYRAEAASQGWEGLILRKNMAYEGRRAKNLIKVKNFREGEFLVTDVEFAPMRIVETDVVITKVNGGEAKTETTREITEEMFAAAVIDYNGEKVNVGSGYSKEQRRTFYKDKTLILGKMITVQYFEPTVNKQGTVKLRFPTFKCVKEKF